MNQDNKDSKTGAELLFDRCIQSAIFMTPPTQLRQDIYKGLEKAVNDDREKDDAFLEIVENLTPRQITAYRILEKMRLLDLSTGFCCVTEEGFKVYDSLGRDGVYRVLEGT